MLDLSSLDVVSAAELAARVELEHPASGVTLRDATGNPYYVDTLGEDAASVRKVERKQSDRRAERIRRGKDWGTDQDTLEEEALERLSVSTVGWYLPPLNGENVPFTKENLRLIFGDPKFSWIVEQTAKAMKDRKRFFSRPSTI